MGRHLYTYAQLMDNAHYPSYLNVELKRILKQRGLKYSGNKAQRVLRLEKYDLKQYAIIRCS